MSSSRGSGGQSYSRPRKGISEGWAALAVIAALVAGILIGIYALAPSPSAATTVTKTTTSVSLTVQTSTQTLPPVTTTTTTTVTTTPQPPLQVAYSGTVQSKGTGTTATGIHFISSTTGVSYPGTIGSGRYTVSNLPNPGTYTVTIDYSNFGGVGGGTCTAGILSAYFQFPVTVQTSNWSC